jgi:hypothetical protein
VWRKITYPLLIFVVSLLLLLLEVLEVIQSLGTAQWCVHFIRVIEQAVINLVFPRLFLKRHERLESVTPQHFAGQVRRSRLCRHPGRFDNACKSTLILDSGSHYRRKQFMLVL